VTTSPPGATRRSGAARSRKRGSDGRPKAVERIADHLREEIMEGRMAPGTWVRQESLAEEFGVSRYPVREAIDQLAQEGLVEVVPRRGTVVRMTSGRQILEVYEVRAALDGAAARLAARRATPETIRRMRDVAERTRAAALRGETLVSLNLEFHGALRAASDNEVLGKILEQIEDTIRRFGASTYRGSGPGLDAVDEHDGIIDAVEAGDEDLAEQRAIAHMHNARERRLRMFFD
jgi:DNA-binding GntR family transcriptional regulator